jgi:small subunit ribosomal protein S20
MANKKSAEKRMRQTEKITARNRAHRSRMRTAVKQVRTAVEQGELEKARELLPETVSILDKTAQKGIIHKNAAARTKSRLVHAVSGAESA